MSDRRATVMLIQRGDAEISGAIAEGMLAARAGEGTPPTRQAGPPPLSGEALTHDQIEVVQAEIDRQHIVRALVRVAVNNTKTAEDYANMTTKARGMYAEPARRGPLRRLGDKLLTGYAMLCWAIGEAYDAQRHVLGRR